MAWRNAPGGLLTGDREKCHGVVLPQKLMLSKLLFTAAAMTMSIMRPIVAPAHVAVWSAGIVMAEIS